MLPILGSKVPVELVLNVRVYVVVYVRLGAVPVLVVLMEDAKFNTALGAPNCTGKDAAAWSVEVDKVNGTVPAGGLIMPLILSSISWLACRV